MAKSSRAIFIFATIVLIVAVAFGAFYYYREVSLYRTDYLEYVTSSAGRYSVDIYLIYAVIKTESSFRTDVVSRAGAVGLMQIMPATAEYIIEGKINPEELATPEINIDIGTMYLSYLIDKFQDINWVIVAYNAGETRAQRWQEQGITIGNIPYKETREYVVKVNRAIRRYKELHYLY